jgi:hypothetical protein
MNDPRFWGEFGGMVGRTDGMEAFHRDATNVAGRADTRLQVSQNDFLRCANKPLFLPDFFQLSSMQLFPLVGGDIWSDP